MKQYVSEGRAMYEDQNHGLFSKSLAEFAIGMMRTEDEATGSMKKITPRKLQDVKDTMKEYKVEIPDEYCYTAWYLFNMAIADYPNTLKNDEQRSMFVEETLFDPDGDATNVLACFEAKMCNAGVPIFWEDYL